MRQAVIDVGSNTIRAVVYEIDANGYRAILNDRDFSSIISYIENGALSEAGIEKLKSVLARMAELCRLLNCDGIHCFATASLRSVNNSLKLLEEIKNEIGLEVEVIAGNEEAFYDYKGLRSVVDVQQGVGLDLGGGSCQVFHFDDDKLKTFQSFPIGCLKVHDKFVAGIMPTPTEIKAIKAYTLECLKNAPDLKMLGFERIYAMGGSARAAAKLHAAFIGSDAGVGGYVLNVDQMSELCSLVNDVSLGGVRVIAKVLPERVNTIVPGLIVLRTVCEYVGADSIEVVKAGVREGYLHSCLLNN